MLGSFECVTANHLPKFDNKVKYKVGFSDNYTCLHDIYFTFILLLFLLLIRVVFFSVNSMNVTGDFFR